MLLPEGPEPMIAIRFPVFSTGFSGMIQFLRNA